MQKTKYLFLQNQSYSGAVLSSRLVRCWLIALDLQCLPGCHILRSKRSQLCSALLLLSHIVRSEGSLQDAVAMY